MTVFRNILCVAEAVDASNVALERAITLAENTQANLTVVTATDRLTATTGMPEGSPISDDVQQALVTMRAQGLETLVAPYRTRIRIETRVLTGTPFLEIIRQVLRDEHDLVIKIPENPEWLDRLFGSDDNQLMRMCPCPVWLVKPQAEKSYRRILAAVDADEDHPTAELKTRRALNLQVLEMAHSLALSEFAELHVVHVWDAIAERALRGAFIHTPEEKMRAYVEQIRAQHAACLNGLIQELTSKLGEETVAYLKPQIHLLKGWARKEVPLLAKRIEADLVVMGTVGRTGIPGIVMGNTAEAILSQLDSSVLAIKPPGFKTPVTITA